MSKLNPGLGNKYEKAKMMRDIQNANVTNMTGMVSGTDTVMHPIHGIARELV